MSQPAGRGLLVLNVEAELIKVDSDFAAMLGYFPHDLLGSNAFRLVYVDDLELAREIFKNLISGVLEQAALEVRLLTKGGEILPVAAHVLALSDINGSSRQLFCSVARTSKNPTQSLLGSDRYRRLVESAKAIPFEYDVHTRSYSFVGPQAVQILGYPLERWTQPKFWHSMAHPDDADEANQAYWSAAMDGGQIDLEYRVYDAAGTLRWLREVAVAVSGPEGPLHYWGFMFDITDRKKAQEALKDSEAQLRQISETNIDLVCTVDEHGHYTYVSQSYRTVLGYQVEQMLGRNAFELIHDEDRAMVRRIFSQSLNESQPGMARFRFLNASGEYIWVESVGNILRDENRRIHGVVISSRDITRQVATEEALTNSRERFRMLVESTGVVAYEFDARSSQITYVAPQMEQLLGHPAEAWYSKDFWRAHVHPDDLKYTDALLQNVASGDVSISASYRMLNAQGRYVWVKDVFYPQVVDGQLGEVRGFLIDVDEEKSVEAELIASRERFRLLVESTGIVAYESDLIEGRVVYVGPQMEQMLGHKLDNWYRPSFWLENIHPDDMAEADRQLEEARRQGVPVQLVYRMLHAQGTAVWVRDHYFPIKREDVVIGERGFIVDISDEKRAEQEHLEMEKQVQQAQRMESLGQMAGGIAHDFNNLLTAIGGYAELASRETGEPETRQLVEQIITSTRRASDLTRQLLAYAGQGRRVQAPCNINSIVREMTSLLQSVISRKVRLRFELAGEDLMVNGEASQLRQVVMELLSNASDSIGENPGEIVVRTTAAALRHPDAQSFYSDGPPKAGTYVILEVEDTGCGMDAQSLRRIFDPFFTTKFTGRGLGLAAVQGIVRAHGGTVAVESRPGLGTSIRIYLPAQVAIELAQPEVKPAPRPTPQTRVDENPQLKMEGCVLVVDDEESVRAITRAILVKQGLKVITAADGIEAVQAVRDHGDEIGLVLLDVTMPRMSGVDAFRAMRELKPDIQVVLSSGYTQNEAYRQFGTEGLCGFVQKPYLRQELLDILSNILAAREPANAEA